MTTRQQVTREYAISQLTKAGCKLFYGKGLDNVREVTPNKRRPLGIKLIGYVELLGADLIQSR